MSEQPNCVSISGGLRDIQVRPALSQTLHCLNVRGESVPLTWTSQDHQSLVWDNGLVLATARTFYDVAHDATYASQITNFHWIKKYSSKNNFQIAARAVSHVVAEMESAEFETVGLTENARFQKLKSGFYRIESEEQFIVISKGDMSHLVRVNKRHHPAEPYLDENFVTEVKPEAGDEIELYVGKGNSASIVSGKL